jgi:predicted anti-sigma-YlaC factor YlaD
MASLFPRVEAAGVIESAPSISHILMNVLYFLLSIVSIVAILSLVVAGLRYMLAFGDTERIASAKKMTTYSIIGIIIAFGSLVLLRGIESFFVQ